MIGGCWFIPIVQGNWRPVTDDQILLMTVLKIMLRLKILLLWSVSISIHFCMVGWVMLEKLIIVTWMECSGMLAKLWCLIFCLFKLSWFTDWGLSKMSRDLDLTPGLKTNVFLMFWSLFRPVLIIIMHYVSGILNGKSCW